MGKAEQDRLMKRITFTYRNRFRFWSVWFWVNLWDVTLGDLFYTLHDKYIHWKYYS